MTEARDLAEGLGPETEEQEEVRELLEIEKDMKEIMKLDPDSDPDSSERVVRTVATNKTE